MNTANLEYRPTLSGDQLLFTRSNRNRVPFHDAWIKVVLFNLSTETSTVLRTLRYTPYYFVSDQVNADWATFESCRVNRGRGIYTNCQVFRYKISTAELEQIANPGLQQYAAAVSGDGTVYLTRSGNRDHWTCGGHAKLVRYPVGEPGVVIATLPDDKDALTTFALDETDGSTTMYFDRSTCRTRRGLSGGIYRVLNADTAA